MLVGLVVLTAARLAFAPVNWPVLAPGRVVTVGVVAYALVFSFVTVTRHYTFQTHALDLGQYAQNMWDLARGRAPYDTVIGWHAWGNHLSPIFYPFSPLTLIFSGPAFLLVLQSVALALGAVPVFFFARRRVGAEAAAGFALLYLLNPSLQGVNVRDFHAAALAIPLLLAAMDFAEAGRLGLCGLTAVLTLTTREDAAIAVVGLGLWLVVFSRRFVLGGALAAVSVAWLFVAVEWLMPSFRDDAVYPYITAHYAHFGDSLGQIVLAPFVHPLRVLAWLATLDHARYLAALLAPLGFLPLAAPLAAVGALPGLAQNLLSDYPVLTNHRTQYQAFVLPFLVVGAIVGFQTLQRWRPAMVTPRRALVVAGLISLAMSARTANDLAVHSWWPGARERAAYRLLAMIPSGATVSVSEQLFPHLYERTTVYVFPQRAAQSDVVLVDGRRLDRRRIDKVAVTRDGDVVTVDSGEARGLRLAVVTEAEGWLLLKPLAPAAATR